MYDCLEGKGEDDWVEGYETEKPKLQDTYNSFINLPYLVDEEEKLVVAQTNACLQYLGDCVGMMGINARERMECVQLLCEIYDLRNVMVEYAYSEPAPGSDAECVLAAQKHFAKFNHHLRNKSVKYHLGGDTFSAPDFHLFEMLHQFDKLCCSRGLPDCLTDHPDVRAFHAGFSKLP